MPRASYQYETSPRKYEPEYTKKKPVKKTATKAKKATKPTTKKTENLEKTEIKKRIENKKAQKLQESKNKVVKVILVLAVFGMLLAVSYREISIMEMFNQKKNLENQLAMIQKENGQVKKSIKEEESKLDWNEIKRRATEELGMQVKLGTPVNLEKSDNVETKNKMIQNEEKSWIEEIISYFINK